MPKNSAEFENTGDSNINEGNDRNSGATTEAFMRDVDFSDFSDFNKSTSSSLGNDFPNDFQITGLDKLDSGSSKENASGRSIVNGNTESPYQSPLDQGGPQQSSRDERTEFGQGVRDASLLSVEGSEELLLGRNAALYPLYIESSVDADGDGELNSSETDDYLSDETFDAIAGQDGNDASISREELDRATFDAVATVLADRISGLEDGESLSREQLFDVGDNLNFAMHGGSLGELAETVNNRLADRGSDARIAFRDTVSSEWEHDVTLLVSQGGAVSEHDLGRVNMNPLFN